MKKILSLILLSFMIASLSACAPADDKISDNPDTPPVEDIDEDQGATNNDEKEEDKGKDKEEDTEEIEEEGKLDEHEEEEKVKEEDEEEDEEEKESEIYEKDVDLYFANPEYIELGNEDLERVKSENRTISYDNETIIEEAVVKELLNGPTDNELYDTGIPEDVKLIDVKLQENMAYVNFAKEGMQGGSLQETLTLEQIITTLLNLETVDSVQFLLDGEISESLMGHISSTEAFNTIPE